MKEDTSQNLKTFNLDGWFGSLIGIQDDYEHLEFYIKNKRVRQSYLDTIKIILIDLTDTGNKNENSKSIFSEDEADKLPHLETIDFAFKQYSNQVLVVLVSCLEQILQEFLEIYYYYKPEKMKQINGYVNLSELLNCKSNVELLTKISKVAAEAIRGGINGKIKSIETITEKKFDKDLINKISELVRKRNDIIHKTKSYNVTSSVLESYATNLTELLKQLGLILKSNKIPVTNNSGLLGITRTD
jgi:hypothetical protein